jgi:hypothetical protein
MEITIIGAKDTRKHAYRIRAIKDHVKGELEGFEQEARRSEVGVAISRLRPTSEVPPVKHLVERWEFLQKEGRS